MLELVMLLLVLCCILAAFWLVNMLIGILPGVIFLALAVFVVLLVWVPGPLDSYLGPVQDLLRVPFELLGQAFRSFAEMVRIVRSS